VRLEAVLFSVFMAKDYDHLFKLLIIGDSGKLRNYLCTVPLACSAKTALHKYKIV